MVRLAPQGQVICIVRAPQGWSPPQWLELQKKKIKNKGGFFAQRLKHGKVPRENYLNETEYRKKEKERNKNIETEVTNTVLQWLRYYIPTVFGFPSQSTSKSNSFYKIITHLFILLLAAAPTHKLSIFMKGEILSFKMGREIIPYIKYISTRMTTSISNEAFEKKTES